MDFRIEELKEVFKKFPNNGFPGRIIFAVLLILPLTSQSCCANVIQLSDHVSLIPGSINGVDIEKDNAHMHALT